jgi:signal transduction histidine kinase/HAMP domain-containing protein
MELERVVPSSPRSIRGKLFLAFLVFVVLMGAFGAYALQSIRDASGLVTRTYDKPLMAINFARSALYQFSEMDRELLRMSVATEAAERERHRARIDALHKTFDEDLGIAAERSLSARSVTAIRDIERLTAAWHDLRRRAAPNGIDSGEWTALDDLAQKIAGKFDLLIDFTAGDGFLIRQDALRAIERSRVANMGAIALILALALATAWLLSRSILRPLGAAVRVAERISEGELDARIPPPGRDETGMLLRSLAVMQDNLRAMMAREVSLRKSAQSQLADALENATEGVILVDASDRIVIANDQAVRFFPGLIHRLAPGETLDEVLREALDRRLMAYPDEGPDEALRLGRPGRFGSGITRLADGRWLRVSRSAARSGGTVVIWSDITALKEREENLRVAKDQAEQANLAKTHFLANISHELRTPLNAIIGFSELISGEALGPAGMPQYVGYASDIGASGRHLLSIINDILDMAHSEAGTLSIITEPVDFAALVETCRAQIAQDCAEAQHRLAFDIAPNLPQIEADPGRLRQIVHNLASNAIKFTPEGGRIDISVRAADDGGIDLIVADSGIGMSEADIAIAFEPFRQVDGALSRRYEGTGLGLPLTKTLVELHNGWLDIVSRPGEGTRVSAHLPSTAVAADRHRGAA